MEQFFDFNWKSLLERIIENMIVILKAYPKEHLFSDFLLFTMPKNRFLSLI